MLGSECIDNLILGSPNAQVQPNQQSAPAQLINNDEERGSDDNNLLVVRQNPSGTKRTKVPLYGQKAKTVQIVVNHGKERFGSVSISLRKLQQGSGSKFIHWVNLYESLDDDLFEAQLGEDEPDAPRVLLEY